MLQADANFQAANDKRVKTPIFVMTFADDAGANQFINLTPVEEPDPVEPVVEPVTQAHVLVAVGAGQEVQTSADGITWTKVTMTGVRSDNEFDMVSVAGGRVFLHGESSSTSGPNHYDQVWSAAIGSTAFSLFFDAVRVQCPIVAYGGRFYYAAFSEYPPVLQTFYASSISGPWSVMDSVSGILIPTDDHLFRIWRTDLDYFTSGTSFASVPTALPTVNGALAYIYNATRDPDTDVIAAVAIVAYPTQAAWLFYSEDGGLTWTVKAELDGLGTDYFYNIHSPMMACGGGYLSCVQDNSGILKYISISDLTGSGNLTAVTVDAGAVLKSITYDAYLSLWVVVGKGGAIYTSADLTTWTPRTPAGGYSGDFAAVLGGAY